MEKQYRGETADVMSTERLELNIVLYTIDNLTQANYACAVEAFFRHSVRLLIKFGKLSSQAS